MKLCLKCGKKFESGKFCKYCGGALVEENAGTQEAHCTNCGTLLKDGAKFCPLCGTKVSNETKMGMKRLEEYELVTLMQMYVEKGTKELEEFIFKKYKEDEFLAEEYKNHDSSLQCFLGHYYSHNNDYEKAFKWYTKASNQGNSRAQYSLGFAYTYGLGCTEDKHKAFEFYEKAAANGNDAALDSLARCYKFGKGCTKDEQKAFEIYKKLAEWGKYGSYHDLGDCYKEGSGCRKDENQAFFCYQKSAEHGFGLSQYVLGNCYKNGIGCEKDDKQAFFWYQKAAEQLKFYEHIKALGECFEKGVGCIKDERQAFEWYKKGLKLNWDDVMSAKYDIARCYDYGIGCEINRDKAIKLYREIVKSKGYVPGDIKYHANNRFSRLLQKKQQM